METTYLDKTYTVLMDACIADFIKTDPDKNEWLIFQYVKKVIELYNTMPVCRVSFSSIIPISDLHIEITFSVNGHYPDNVHVYKPHSDIWEKKIEYYRVKFKNTDDGVPRMIVTPR